MKRTLLENVVSFLLGIFWALLISSAVLLFEIFYPVGLLPAIVAATLSTVFWLLFIVFLELVNIQIEKLKEIRRQSEILNSIKKALDENKISDNGS